MRKNFKVSVVALIILITVIFVLWQDVTIDRTASGPKASEALTSVSPTSGTVTKLEKDAKAFAQKDDSSDVIAEFSKGDSAFVVNVSDDWTEIYYKGETAYIPSEQISGENIAGAEKSAQDIGRAVDEEIEKNDRQTGIEIDNYLRKQRQKSSALIWKVAIGGLLALIIAVSILIGIMNKDNAKKNVKESDPEKENINETNNSDSVL
ncbi:hypothetical protein [Ruminococcus sp.]|uniref:hypothetical protein n=1 Tax=Ruminococcus sp. TaxID=41978 RepID=UPI0025F6E612|nr:hypothetical protein [Ruminococcus sp.]